MALVLTAIAFLIGLLVCLAVTSGRREKHLPPGPKTLPIIGNIHQIPKERAYLKFNDWAREYGPIYSVKVASQTMVVLTDRRLVKELMDKRSAVSSNRPKSYIMEKMVYDGDDIILMQANDPHWKIARRFMHQNFMSSVVEKTHMPLLEAELSQMLREMVLAPKEFMKHPTRFANSFMMSVAYGIRTPHSKISHMVEIGNVLKNLTTLLAPGTLPPVDIFPFTFYLPHQIFGRWRDKVAVVRKTMNNLYAKYLGYVVERRKTDGERETFADKLIEQEEKLDWTWHGLCFTAGLMMEAGSDTTSGTINSFLLLMTRFPDAYKKAQQQIDSVVGSGRSPRWDDWQQLTEVNKLLKETLRMRPVSPIAFPHALSEEVWLEGMRLPKGSDIIVNVLGLHYDERYFPNPQVFDPERYANYPLLADAYASSADYAQRDHYAYGTGRRICVGIHLAERAAFLAIAKILWAFDILPGRDAANNVIENDLDWATGSDGGIIVLPKPFACELRLRSTERKETIWREFGDAERTEFPKYLVPDE